MFVCSECGNESLKWQWQCGSCKTWWTLKEFKVAKVKALRSAITQEFQELSSIQERMQNESRINTSSWELNTVLWGGIIPGSIILLSGEPGIGKSTLSLSLWKYVSDEILYISGEETEVQISSRATRLEIIGSHMKLLSESNFENIFASIQKTSAKIIVFDSISVMYSPELSGTAGSITQIRYITEKIVEFGKQNNICCIIIGHVTKDGNVAGPKTLEHMVDTVLYFEWESYDDIRMLRCLKNRFGSSSEIGLYRMVETGLQDIANPGLEFINQDSNSIGSSLSITMQWSRPLVIETESLTTYTKFGYPKRSSRGINTTKLDLIIAVLSKYTPVKLESYDVYVNISRGLSIPEPALDLSIAASIASSKMGKVIPKDSLFIWEISLTWNLRPVLFLEKRLKQALKMGFKRIYIPKVQKDLTEFLPQKDISIVTQIWSVSELIKLLKEHE